MTSEARIECISLTLTGQILQDASTGNYSLMNIIENLGLDSSGLGKPMPIEVHSNWLFPTDSVGKAYEVRVVVSNLDTGESYRSKPGSISVVPNDLAGTKLIRGRVRVQGFQAPPAFGDYELIMEYREVSTEAWTKTSTRWLLGCIEFQPADVSTIYEGDAATP